MLKEDGNLLDLCVKGISYTNECHFNNEVFKMFPLIRFDGSVQPCQGLRQEEFCIGNLLRQDVEEILSRENKLLVDFLHKVRLRREKLEQNNCKKCTLNKKCGKGCIAESVNNGDFYGVSLKCEIRKKELLYKLKTLTGKRMKTSYQTIQWHITEVCPNRCKHCYIGDITNEERRCNELRLKEMIAILDNFQKFENKYNAEIKHFVITGGDPFEHPDFQEFLEELNNRNKNITILGIPERISEENIRLLEESFTISIPM